MEMNEHIKTLRDKVSLELGKKTLIMANEDEPTSKIDGYVAAYWAGFRETIKAMYETECTTTKFEPAEITFKEERKSMDEVVNILNSYKAHFKKEGFYLDWSYKDFMQAINPQQLSVDIVYTMMKSNFRPAPDEKVAQIIFTVEKNDYVRMMETISVSLKSLVEE